MNSMQRGAVVQIEFNLENLVDDLRDDDPAKPYFEKALRALGRAMGTSVVRGAERRNQ